MNYEEMSDFEINKSVAKIEFKEFPEYVYDDSGLLKNDSVSIFREYGRYIGIRDYCNNPSDAWPIITENKIDFEWLSVFVEASDITGKHSYEDFNNNALRACMIVFLKMKEAGQ